MYVTVRLCIATNVNGYSHLLIECGSGLILTMRMIDRGCGLRDSTCEYNARIHVTPQEFYN